MGTKSDWKPSSLWAPLSGRLFLGIIKMPFVLLLLWISTLFRVIESKPFSDLLMLAILVVLVSEIGATFIDRIFVIRHKHVAPGGKLNVVLQWLGILTISFFCGWLITTSVPLAIACSSVLGIISAVEIYWLKAWQQGDSKEEVHEKWEKTKEMTRETFEDDWKETRKMAHEKQRNRYNKKRKRQDK